MSEEIPKTLTVEDFSLSDVYSSLKLCEFYSVKASDYEPSGIEIATLDFTSTLEISLFSPRSFST